MKYTEEKIYTEMGLDRRGIKWEDSKMNILIPMAGAGSRFAKAGYTFPKPLIEVRNKPMIQVVIENLNVDAHFIYVVQKEHFEKYNLKSLLNVSAPYKTHLLKPPRVNLLVNRSMLLSIGRIPLGARVIIRSKSLK